MKNRLQFRFHKPLFQTRAEALDYVKNIFDKATGQLTSLEAEPLILFYGQEEKVNAILCLGNPGEKAGYFTIDSADLDERLASLKNVSDGFKENLETINKTLTTITQDISGVKMDADKIKKNAGLTSEGDYVVPLNSKVITDSTTIVDALAKLDKALDTNITNLEKLSTDVETNAQNIANLVETGKEIKGLTVNAKKISDNPVLNGSDIALTGYQKAPGHTIPSISPSDSINVAIGKLDTTTETNTANIAKNKVSNTDKSIIVNTEGLNTVLSVNIDKSTIVSNEKGELEVASDKLVQYDGLNAIKVSPVKNGVKTISLDVKSGDPILYNGSDGLSSTLTLKWAKGEITEEGEKVNDEIQLLGRDNKIISRIDVAEFLKDGMVDNVEYDAIKKQIKITFNTASGKDTIVLSIADLVDEYTAGDGISVDGHKISVVMDPFINNGIQKKIDENLIATEVTSITEEEAKNQTLITRIKDGHYYVSKKNDAVNIAFDTTFDEKLPEGYDNVQRALEKALNRIKDLENKIKELESGVFANAVTEVAALPGKERELQFNHEGNRLEIGFADDAIFRAGE